MPEFEKIKKKDRRQQRVEIDPAVDAPGGPDDTTLELQVSTSDLLDKISRELVANSVDLHS